MRTRQLLIHDYLIAEGLILTPALEQEIKIRVSKCDTALRWIVFATCTFGALFGIPLTTLKRIPVLKLVPQFLLANAFLSNGSDHDEAGVFLKHAPIGKDHGAYDLIVIGSGPGGAIAALRGAEAGKRVLVIEEGPFVESGSAGHHSVWQTENMFRLSGLQVALGFPSVIFAQGSTVGGGSEVNSGLYHNLVGPHRESILSATGISENEWQSAEKRVELEIGVKNSPKADFSNDKFRKGALLSGHICEEIPRWRDYEPLEAHNGMLRTYLAKGEALGTRIISNTRALKIESDSNYLTVIASYNDSDEDRARMVTYKGKEIVLSCGPFETPKLLRQSRLIKSRWTRVQFHPMVRIVAAYEEMINDGNLFPSLQSWDRQYSFKAGYSVSTFPFIQATLASMGINPLKIKERLDQCSVYFASIALRNSYIYSSNSTRFPLQLVKWDSREKRELATAFDNLRNIASSGDATKIWPTRKYTSVSTVHTFGSMPLGETRLLDESGRLMREPRIAISDASVIPHAPWGNPQGAIMVLCEILAQRRN